MTPMRSNLVLTLEDNIEAAVAGAGFTMVSVDLLVKAKECLESLSAAHTIKPLVWEDGDNTSFSGPYIVAWMSHLNCWMWRKCNDVFIEGTHFAKCDSMEHGKQLCQQHWESEAGIGKYLEAVK